MDLTHVNTIINVHENNRSDKFIKTNLNIDNNIFNL